MSYPEVVVHGISETPETPVFYTAASDTSDDKLIEEVLEFYKRVLIPQLVCAPDGVTIPEPYWLKRTDVDMKIITVRSNGELHGVWISKGGQVLYPVANNSHIALIYRLLWDETTKHYDYVWAYTSNPVIKAFINKAVRVPAGPTTPAVNGDKVEWHR